MTLALTKSWNEADLAELRPEMKIVNHHFESAAQQHPLRLWEYAMALKAADVWHDQAGYRARVIYDVGGAGSPFRSMAGTDDRPVRVIDPAEPLIGRSVTLAEYMSEGAELGAQVFCLSVLEHIKPEELDRFLYHLACLTAPGGLLFLTMDYWDQPDGTKDFAHFHWMREQIFTAGSRSRDILQPLLARDFTPLGDSDFTVYPTYSIWGYSVASLALVKRS